MEKAQRDDLKELLDRKAAEYNTEEFITRDPVQFPRRYEEKRDIETVALLTSTIAWGNRRMILRSCGHMLELMGSSPYGFIMEGGAERIDPGKNIHRTFFGRDFQYICRGLNGLYTRHNDMEELFAGSDPWEGIARLRETLAEGNGMTYSRHISNPDTSACKRLHMMLRWLCRRDGIVDIGIWRSISPADLRIPLDVHVGRIARSLELIERKANDRKSVELLTAELRRMDPEDPTKYDFALFGMGESGETV